MTKRHNSEKSKEDNSSLEKSEKNDEKGKILYFPGNKPLNQSRINALFRLIFGDSNNP